MNNKEYWTKYNNEIKEKLNKLCKKKKHVLIDLHIHSDFSSDGKQTLEDIITIAEKLKFDVISITDHDNVNVYSELYAYLQKRKTNIIIIPGVEITVDEKKYGSQCHILQYFINPFDEELQEVINKNYKASFNRSLIQFKRLNENEGIQYILNKNKIKISYEEYKKYLIKLDLFPEYDTLIEYLVSKFKKVNVNNFYIFDLLEKYNISDKCEERKIIKQKRYLILRQKYNDIEENYYNSRMLLSLLAVREVDDDWWDFPSSGSLSVNSYGQIKIFELSKNHCFYFAHPEESKLEFVENIIKNNKNFKGIELNYCSQTDKRKLTKLIKKNNVNKILGSDSHESNQKYYENIDFYKMSAENLMKFVSDIN